MYVCHVHVQYVFDIEYYINTVYGCNHIYTDIYCILYNISSKLVITVEGDTNFYSIQYSSKVQ